MEGMPVHQRREPNARFDKPKLTGSFSFLDAVIGRAWRHSGIRTLKDNTCRSPRFMRSIAALGSNY